jgi:hypothetical protein
MLFAPCLVCFQLATAVLNEVSNLSRYLSIATRLSLSSNKLLACCSAHDEDLEVEKEGETGELKEETTDQVF